MSRNFTAESAAQIITLAFTPLRCVAEPWDYGHRVRFRIFDGSDKPVLTIDELVKHQFADAMSLESAINAARSILRERGFSLAPWVFPK
ncbi:hypothetical protein [Azotobacter chroococcum]|uniref:hypothetical protein n=1 Tax=Azotobacter chroococcum TaxID=353 RepID=UPI0012FDBCBD|nr:hypothetical protein [Azotobacter chroococcum]